ncbi:MAG: hypothetical protein ACSLE0_22765 [Chitinophagaceae bacterium]
MLSRVSVILIFIVLVGIRIYYIDWNAMQPIPILTWDAFGYYMYLPGQFIYDDIEKMEWVHGIIEKYGVTGNLYQLSDVANGNKVTKYLAGISILYAPFFGLGHLAADWFNYPQDGFSTPYQIAIAFAALCYALLGLCVLRWVLLRYFSDLITAITLLLVALATNYSQYVSVDSAMTHGYIFSLYALLLALTILWHEKPTHAKAFLIGLIIGLGIISRPTELVMIFIPVLYGTHLLIEKQKKWSLVRQHVDQLAVAMLGGLIGILPQLVYWKMVTNSWVYDVGSKWTFLQPNWQVLFGWEKGWFIYTPVTIFIVLGLFCIRKNPFYRSVLIYFILNLWIVIAWSDWRYGASYSTRALVQSYAVMAIPLAMLIQFFIQKRFKYIVFSVSGFLILLNLFQIWQYNKGILHYDHMNKKYYQAIFLDPCPSPLEMSLLDTEEYIYNPSQYMIQSHTKIDSQFLLNIETIPIINIFKSDIHSLPGYEPSSEQWLQIKCEVFSAWGAFDTELTTQLDFDHTFKITSCRMQNGISKYNSWNKIEYYFRLPVEAKQGELSIFATTKSRQNIYIRNLSFDLLRRI